jgi:hypothetical protein
LHKGGVGSALAPCANRARRNAHLSRSGSRANLIRPFEDCFTLQVIEAPITAFAGFALFAAGASNRHA